MFSRSSLREQYRERERERVLELGVGGGHATTAFGCNLLYFH